MPLDVRLGSGSLLALLAYNNTPVINRARDGGGALTLLADEKHHNTIVVLQYHEQVDCK